MTFKRFPRLGGRLHAHSSRRLAIADGGPGRRRGGTGRRNCRHPVEHPGGRSSCGNQGAVHRRHDFVRGRPRPPAPPHDFSNDRCWLGFAPLSDFATEIFDATLGNAFSKAMALKFDLGQVGQDSVRKRQRRRFDSWRFDFRGLDRGRDSKRFSVGRGQRELRFDPPQIRAHGPAFLPSSDFDRERRRCALQESPKYASNEQNLPTGRQPSLVWRGCADQGLFLALRGRGCGHALGLLCGE